MTSTETVLDSDEGDGNIQEENCFSGGMYCMLSDSKLKIFELWTKQVIDQSRKYSTD